MLPLEGIKVISLEQAVAAPFASRQLADLGARVIKIERPGSGDFARDYDETVNGMSSHFVWLNRSKESLTLNIKSDDGKKIFKELLSDADILIQNLAPGAVERLGFDNEELHAINDQLIICHISGYGSEGAYAKKKAYDLIIQADSGLLSITGTDDFPSKAGISVADIAAGMYAYSGVLSSLIKRSKTKKGTVLDISMLEALGEWMGYPMYYSVYGNKQPKRTGAEHATIYPYGPFPVKYDDMVFFAIQNEREWKNFCEHILEDLELATDERFNMNSKRVDNKEQLQPIIESALIKRSAEEVLSLLEENKIANAQLNTMKQFFEHPQLMKRNRWFDMETPVGPIKSLLPPVLQSKDELNLTPIPEIGEQSESILQELGWDGEQIEQLRNNHII
ncbi:CoA transferase [Oceanobacillus jeddahense]|uniref:CoA transferase n=1 Tax=Oceanobacillus jeddahense TaxID=1462527 RepID=A0ABY5JUB3_9BACI|nr:CaiB/BaiF CoA-transferase family protein [Oceanobacillus jeddahense]UUI02467.1 CoA transferase [Oceanobacillus jeddahense]